MLPTIYILAQDTVGASGVAGPIDIFHTANLILKNIVGEDAEQIKWKIVGLNKGDVRSAAGMIFKSDMTLDQLVEPGWIYLPGFVVENETELLTYLESNRALLDKLKKLYSSGFSLASNCTGAFLLAESGILDGKSATTTWWLEDFFQKRYPKVDLDINNLIVENDRTICSATAMAHMELATYLVEKLLGGKCAHLCRKYLLMENGKKTQTPFRRLANAKDDGFIQSANRYLLEHLGEELRIDELADFLAVSNRTLSRRFKESTGDSPLQHIQKLRIERSKYLLETSNLPATEIMQRVGYQDSSSFGQVFKRFTGLTPGQYRQKFCA